MSFKIIKGVLAADVANGGTFVVGYPPRENPENGNTTAGDFYLAMGHALILNNSVPLAFPNQFDVTLGASQATITNASGATWKAGTPYVLSLQQKGKQVYTDFNSSEGGTSSGATGNRMAQMTRSDTFNINLGQPATTSTTAALAATAVATAALNALAYTNDVPRAMQVVSSNAGDTTQTVTIYGKDIYGAAMQENFTLNGTTAVLGKKAFSLITGYKASAALAGNLSIGNTNILGLPVHLPSAGFILKELQDGAVATAGTTVAGLRASGGATATSADVRGTYTPNSAPNGSRVYELLVSLPDPGNRGVPQYSA